MVRFPFWVRFFFLKCVLPEGLAKELPKIVKYPERLDLIDCTMVVPISTCNFHTQNTPDAIKHIPDVF